MRDILSDAAWDALAAIVLFVCFFATIALIYVVNAWRDVETTRANRCQCNDEEQSNG
jgi:4-hydroxybenzoate polyprenyltransferase